TFASVPVGAGEQLRLIDLHNGGFDQASLTLSVVKAPAGDGLANVGYVNATGHRLGDVLIPGDLGQIDAGDPATGPTPGLRSLTVRSLGRLGTASQGAGGSLESDVLGPLGALTVTGDIAGATVYVSGSADGTVGAVRIGGSILGGADPNSGQVQSTGDMGPVTVGGDIVGGTGAISGAIDAGGKLAGLTVGGSLIGGAGFS